MQYRKIPKTGDMISAIGYGCMRLPSRLGQIDEKKAEEQMRYAISQGVNYFDTAYPYHGGNSESFLGKVFSDRDLRSKVKIATKLPPWSVKSREDMDRILDRQLEKLNIDTIDYYLVHGIMDQGVWDRMKRLGIIDFLERAQKKGKIKNVGFSCHSDLKTFKNVIDDYDWSMCQIQYNYLDENIQAGKEGLEYAASKDIAVFIMEPLRGGNLAGKIPKQAQREWQKSPVKRSPADWALRWIWNHPQVTCVLSGMNDDEHIRENIKTARTSSPGSMSEEEVETVNRVKSIYKSLTKVSCTACSYCLPCPAGVNIPQCFEKYNNKYMFGGLEPRLMYMVQLGGVMNENPGKASQCINCGKCEQHCPQHIEIRRELKKVSSELEGMIDKPASWVLKRILNARR